MKRHLTRANIAAFVLITHLILGARQSPGQDITAETTALASDLVHASSAKEWFSLHAGQVTKEHAVAAEKMALEAWNARDLDKAYPYSTFAMYAFLFLGDRPRSLENSLYERDESFAMAETPERYEFLRGTVLSGAENAASIGRDDLVFKFMVLAGECSFFASTAKTGRTADQPLFDALQDEMTALLLVKPDSDRYWFERLVSLTAGTINKTKRFAYLDEEEKKMNTLRKGLSAVAEVAIPADFTYTLSQWGDRKKSIYSGWVLADLSYEFGDATVASRRMTVAAERAKQISDQELWLSILSDKYRAGRDAGMPADQLRLIRDEARNGSRELRGEYQSRAGRIWVGHRADQLYGDLLRDQLAESQEVTPASFSFAESLKARTLLDALYFPPVPSDEPADLSALEQQALGYATAKQEKSVTDDIGRSERRLISHLSFFYEDMMSAYEEGPSPRMKAIGELESAYKKTGKGFHSVAAPAPLADVQRSLEPREAIIEYVIPYHRSHPAFDLYILFITPTSARSVHVVLNEVLPFNVPMIGTLLIGSEAWEHSQLGEMIAQARIAIQDGDEKRALESLHSLHKILIQPLTNHGIRLADFDRLVIVPHGPLHYVPFAALMDDDGKYLISKAAITVAPSASVWLALTRRIGPVQRFVGFGDPDLRSLGAADLKYAGQEMTDIPKLLNLTNLTVFVGSDATEDRFEQEAPSANLLHVSTHGVFPDDDAIDRHAIFLTKGKSGDGTLRAARVRQLKLSSTRLVALSVCNGGLYRIGPADEPYGLVSAFLEAGSQNVLGTLWKLDDQFGRDFMEEFYRHLLQDGPAEAFRKTCLHFLNLDEDLRNWAAFVLVGPGRSFPTQRN